MSTPPIRFSPALAGYLAVGVASSILAYVIIQKFWGKGGYFAQTSLVLDQYATEAGTQNAAAVTDPEIALDRARSDWARAHGWDGLVPLQQWSGFDTIPADLQTPVAGSSGWSIFG